MPTTPVYGIPYPALSDAPNGPSQIQAAALEVETELVRIDAAVAAINGLDTAFAGSTTDETGFTNTTFAAGGTTVGVAFVAPASGKVMVHYTAAMLQNINTFVTIVSFEMKTGGTVGSGTLVGAAANGDRALVCGRAVNSGAVAQLSAGNWALYTGLTPGATYNVRMLHVVDGGSGTITYRQISVQPQL